MSIFNKFKKSLQKTRTGFTDQLKSVFSNNKGLTEELIDEIFNTRIQFATQQNTNVAKIKSLKKDYARVLTIKREKTLQAGS